MLGLVRVVLKQPSLKGLSLEAQPSGASADSPVFSETSARQLLEAAGSLSPGGVPESPLSSQPHLIRPSGRSLRLLERLPAPVPKGLLTHIP